MSSDKKILFVTYGGGHVRMIVPLIKHLRSRYTTIVLGLTTAGSVLDAEGIPFLGFRHLVRPGDEMAIQAGRDLASGFQQKIVDQEETVAYLGLSYRDLEENEGIARARELYKQYGRHIFLPLQTIKRFMLEVRPDLIVTTISPRAERAAVIVARELHVPSLCIMDIPTVASVSGAYKAVAAPDYGDRLCVPTQKVKDDLVTMGRPADHIYVTGNPAFDNLANPALAACAKRLRESRGWGNDSVILWLSQPEAASSPVTGQKGDLNLPRQIDRALMQIVQGRTNWRVVIRPHPSEKITYADLPERVELSNQTEDLATLIWASNVAITLASTAGLQAALIGKPVIGFRSVSSHVSSYEEMGFRWSVSRIQDLEQVIDDALNWRNPSPILPLPTIGHATERVAGLAESMLGE